VVGGTPCLIEYQQNRRGYKRCVIPYQDAVHDVICADGLIAIITCWLSTSDGQIASRVLLPIRCAAD